MRPFIFVGGQDILGQISKIKEQLARNGKLSRIDEDEYNKSRYENSVCTKRVCEYNWVLEERHSMTWRTFDHKKGKNNDYKVKVDELNDNFVLDLNTFRPHPPYNKEQTAYKDPNHHLSQILTNDGRDNRYSTSILNTTVI